MKLESLNKSDAFILDDGTDIYQWNAPKTNKLERMKANEYSKKIRDNEHSGKANIYIIGIVIYLFNLSLDVSINFCFLKISDENEDNEKFWQILNCKKEDVKENSDVSDEDFEVDFKSSKICLYKLVSLNII